MNRLLVSIMCLLATVGFGFGLLYPEYQEVGAVWQKVEEKERELKSQEEYFSDLEQISQRLKEYDGSLLKIDSAFPSSPDLPSLYQFFQKISFENGVILKGISHAVSESSVLTPGIKETKISLSLTGSYSAFKNYISVLQKNSRLFSIESINFSSPEEGEQVFSFSLNIKVYSY